jgi:hypothetical protein
MADMGKGNIFSRERVFEQAMKQHVNKNKN